MVVGFESSLFLFSVIRLEWPPKLKPWPWERKKKHGGMNSQHYFADDLMGKIYQWKLTTTHASDSWWTLLGTP